MAVDNGTRERMEHQDMSLSLMKLYIACFPRALSCLSMSDPRLVPGTK